MLGDAGFGRVVAFEPWTTNRWYSVPPAAEAKPTALIDKVRYGLRHRYGRARSGRMVFHAYV
jgi:hypothetical protein